MTEVLIAGQPYPLAVDAQEGLLWRVTDVGQPVGETWEDWSGGGFETEHKPGTYLYSDGFDATRNGVLRLSPTIESVNIPVLSQNHGYFFEATGAAATLAQDGSTVTASTASASSITQAYTVGTGNHQVLVVRVAKYGVVNPITVTYAGITLSEAGGTQGGYTIWVYYLLAPPQGTANVVVGLAETTRAQIVISSYNNVNQTSPFGTGVAANGTGTAVSATASTVSGERVLDMGVAVGSVTVSVGANQTSEVDASVGGDRFFGSFQAGADGGVMTWTISSSVPWRTYAAPLKPSTTRYVYCADGDIIAKMTYDSVLGPTLVTLDDGTATAGASTTITLQSGDTYSTNALANYHIKITDGTGSGQWRRIASNTNANPSVLTVSTAWDINPSTDSTYSIYVIRYVASAAFASS